MSLPIERLELGRCVTDELFQFAEGARPDECCGGLFGHRAGTRAVVTAVVPAANSSRSTRARFEIDGEPLVALYRAGRQNDLEWVGFYHSHPRGGVTPSRHDLAGAWAGFAQLIIGPTSQEMAGWVVDTDRSPAARRIQVEVS